MQLRHVYYFIPEKLKPSNTPRPFISQYTLNPLAAVGHKQPQSPPSAQSGRSRYKTTRTHNTSMAQQQQQPPAVAFANEWAKLKTGKDLVDLRELNWEMYDSSRQEPWFEELTDILPQLGIHPTWRHEIEYKHSTASRDYKVPAWLPDYLTRNTIRSLSNWASMMKSPQAGDADHKYGQHPFCYMEACMGFGRLDDGKGQLFDKLIKDISLITIKSGMESGLRNRLVSSVYQNMVDFTPHNWSSVPMKEARVLMVKNRNLEKRVRDALDAVGVPHDAYDTVEDGLMMLELLPGVSKEFNHAKARFDISKMD
jgi:hypothetical protein